MKYLLTILLCSAVLLGRAQRIEEGMAVPDLTLKLVNYGRPVIKLSDLRPRLVILDFWNTHCYNCMLAFPGLDSLQRRMGDTVQLILVNSESRAETEAFFRHHPKIKRPRLPMVMGDSELLKRFTREGYPYSVWIDGRGIVRHITPGYNSTAEHVRQVVAGGSLPLRKAVKKKQVSWLTKEPWQEKVVFFSALSRFDGEYEVGNSLYETDSSVRLSHRGDLLHLFLIAWSENQMVRFNWPGSYEVHVKDPEAYIEPKDRNRLDEWLARHSYNYELIAPPSRRADIYTLMQADLQRFAGVKAEWQKRIVHSYTLVRTGTVPLGSKGGTPSGQLYAAYHEYPAPGSMRVLTNQPFSLLTDALKMEMTEYGHKPFVDETGYNGPIDIAVPWETVDRFNLESWRQVLQKYGLDIIEKPQTVEILVIHE